MTSFTEMSRKYAQMLTREGQGKGAVFWGPFYTVSLPGGSW